VPLVPGAGVSTATTQPFQLAAGSHSISVSYSGDNNYYAQYPLPGASTTLQVNSNVIGLVLTSSTAATTAGTVVTFQAQASGATLPTGETITLTGLPDAANVTPTVNASGVASFSYGLFPPQTTPYTITASYAGDGNYAAATSNSVSLQVNPTPVSVILTPSANPVTYPTAINLTATTTTNGVGVLTGPISFQNNGSTIGTGTLQTVGGSSGLTTVGTYDTFTGQTVIAIATGDFNKDGYQDLAVLESGSGSASLLISLGNGNGTFQAPTTYSSTTFGFDPASVAIAAADFNNDGYTDLVVAASDGTVVVLLAKGDAAGDLTFSQAFNVSGALAVATGDFNKDGNQDFVVIGPSNVTAFYGSSNGNFPSEGSWSNSFDSVTFTGVTVADFNQDGFADFAVSDNSNLDAAVFIYEPDGQSFAGPYTYPVGASATGIASGDINGDGYPDLAVLSQVDSTVLVLLNSGSGGRFNSAGASYGVAYQPTAIAMADFNHDSFADIAVTGTGTGQGGGTTILLGSGSLTMPMGAEASLPSAFGQAIATGDFNSDGNPDLAVGLNGVTTFLDSAAQAVVTGITLPGGTSPLTAVYQGSDDGLLAGTTSSTVFEVVNLAQPVISWPNPAVISYGTALTTAQLNATASVPGTFTYTPALGTILTAGTQELSVSFVPTDTVDYVGTTASVSITVNQIQPTISWSNPAAIAYGTALSNTQLNATHSVPGTLTYTPALGTILTAGTHQLFVSFLPNDSIDYLEATASVSITVNQAASAVAWSNPAAIPYGTALGGAQLNATASVPGTLTYTPALGTILAAGAHQLSVSFVPSDSVDYLGATGSVSITVNQAASTVTWASPAVITYGTALGSAQLNATASVPGTFTYTPALGTILTAGAHQLSVSFVPSDSVDYLGATGSVSITVNQAASTVTWSNPAVITYGTALGGAQLNATASVPGTFTYTPALGTILTAGAHQLSVSFVPSDSVDYLGATGSVSITVNQAASTVTWSNPATITYGTALGSAQLNATASVPGTFTYTPALGTILTAGAHQLSVSFVPSDSVDYLGATGSVSITVNQAASTVTWSNPAVITYGTALGSAQLNATASVPGTLTYTPPLGTILTAGSHTLAVSFTPTDAADYSSTTASVSITVNQAASTVTWANPAAITYGAPLGSAQLNATASVPGTFTYTPAAGTTLTAGTHSLSVSFVPTDNTDYANATATASITVNQAAPVITWNSPAAITYGTALGASQLDATASTGGTLTYTPAAGTVLGAGPQTLNVSFTPSDTVDYSTASASVSLQVNQATPVITWSNPAPIGYGTQLSAVQLDATATPAGGVFTYTPDAGTTLPEGTQTLSVSYTPTDTVDYAIATKSVTIQVNPSTISLGLTSSADSISSGTVVTFQVHADGAGVTAGQTITLTGLPTAATVTLALNDSGFASYSYGLFPPGTYSIQASYGLSPPGTYSIRASSASYSSIAATTSNTVSLEVGPTPVHVSLAPSANPVPYPAAINLTANATSGGLGVPTGSVNFQNSGNQIGTGSLATVNGSSGLNVVGTFDTVTGQTVTAVATGDFNKDGKQDLAVLESGSGSASLLISLGNGDGTFQAPTVYSSTSYGFDPTTVAIAAADFNGDGYTDLVVIASDGEIAVILAAGDAAGDLALTQAQLIPTSIAPLAVATGDFNKDGNQDFVVIGANTVTVFYGTGSTPSNFPAQGSWTTTINSSNFTGITVADFNHDGYADFAISDNAGPDAAVFLYNSESSGFTGPQTYPVGSSAIAIASGDINGDGYPDLAVVSNVDSTVSVLINNGPGGSGTLSSTGTSYGVASQPAAIAINDFNQDGYADIAVAGTGTGEGGGTTILLGSSSGAMTGETSLATANGLAIASADFNNDGNPDLAVGNAGIAVFLDSAAQAGLTNVTLPAGIAPLTAVYQPSDSGLFAGSTSPIVNEVVTQSQPIISWSNPAAITYGTALGGTQLNATASVPGTFTYSPALGTILTAGTQQLSVSFVPNDTVDYVGTTASVSITVNQAQSTVTWSNPAAIPYDTALGSAQLDATASVPGTFTYTPALGTILTAGPHQLSVNFVPSDSVDYLGATGSVSITVNQAASTVTWSNPAAITYGTALGSAQLNATASAPGSFTYTPALGTLLTAGSHTLAVSFTPTDPVDYSSATASVSILVNQATPVITWTPPGAITYGTALGASQLDATASTAGTMNYTPAAGNVLGAGPQTLNVSFTPSDTVDYTTATGSVPLQVNQATPVITWSNPAPVIYGTQLSATQLNATATPAGGAFAYAPPLGTTLPLGTQTLRVSYTPADTTDYTTASASVTIQVTPGLALSSIQPSSGSYGSSATIITLTGTGFTANAIVQLNGTTIPSSYSSPTQITAQVPASFFQQTQPGAITVTNPSAALTTAPIDFTVTLPNLQIAFSGPSSEPPGQQPGINLQFLAGYPLPLQATLTLTVQPATPGGPVDPAVQFSTGGTTLTFVVPANSTTIPAIQLQTGTLPGTITVTLTLESGGQDFTPAGLQPVVIDVPQSPPVITSVSLTRNGDTLTVTVQGYSSSQSMTNAVFNFTPVPGETVSTPQVTIDVSTEFSGWYSQAASIQYGSAFSYTQVFQVVPDASSIGTVSVTLTNSQGSSNTVTAN
jgi:hypothetical protein